MEGQSPQGGNAAEIPAEGMETIGPPLSDSWPDHLLHETLPTPACPVSHRELPSGYGEDYVVLMARDPTWVFAYWEITPEAFAHARETLRDDECQIMLRVYDLEPSSKRPLGHFDVTVHPYSQAWHIHTGKLGGSFQVGIGIRTPHGVFREIARSNIIATPRGTISPQVDEQWLTVEEFYWLSQHPEPGHSPMEWQKRRESRLAALEAYPTSPGIFSPMGASFQAARPQEEAQGQVMFEPPFFLEVQTELILHGQTSPGSMVTVGDETISVDPGGNFTLRFALPDGTISLPVKAISPDQRKGSIQLLVTRQERSSKRQS